MSKKINGQSLFDVVKADAIAADNSAAHYLTQERQRFEQSTITDIEHLKKEIWRLHRLISLMMVILLAIAALGGVLCLL